MRVVVDNRFPKTKARFEKAWLRAVDRASNEGVRAVRSSPTRYQIRGILQRTRKVPARVVGDRIVGGFVNPDFREIFFEEGTLTRRRKPLRRPRRRQVSRGGIHPQRSMARGRKIAIGKLREFVVAEGTKVRG